MSYLRLGDLLINAGAITNEQLEEALAAQKGTGKRLGELLIEQNYITEEVFMGALQQQLGIDYVDLTSVSIPVELAKYVSRGIARKHNLVPVKLVKDTLFIAMSDPLDFVGQEEVKTVSRKKVIPMIASQKAVKEAIAMLYGSEGTAKAIEDMKLEAGETSADLIPVQMTEVVADDSTSAPTIRFVNSVIERAFEERASDIHMEPQNGEMIVRMRIDGLLHKILTVPSSLQATVISRIKIMGGMNISERKIPQDGHSIVNIKGHKIDLRISSIPTLYGEKIVIRLLDKSSSYVSKEAIGLTGDDLKNYDALLKNSNGVILLTGPTGSGKSTTMCTMLTELATESVNVETLEDPVEYDIPGVAQCQINEKQGMTFAGGLRALLRQDPDIIGVGEIRDGETGTIAMRAAITGHLVISTLHTNDSVSAVQRLEDIGVESYLVANSLRGVISQRLVRKICPECRKEYEATEEEKEFLGLDKDKSYTFYKGEGCPACHHSGYQGRRGAFEIFMINSKIRNMIADKASYDDMLAAAKENGLVSMKDACTKLVMDGITTVSETMKAVNSTAAD